MCKHDSDSVMVDLINLTRSGNTNRHTLAIYSPGISRDVELRKQSPLNGVSPTPEPGI